VLKLNAIGTWKADVAGSYQPTFTNERRSVGVVT
jgi:hypothetical protein